jgi:pimeloyl-ACP methyl ester carboxylesterase
VPLGFEAHVKNTLPSARHLELDCGHVPQIEQPAETHAAVSAFLQEPLPNQPPVNPETS